MLASLLAVFNTRKYSVPAVNGTVADSGLYMLFISVPTSDGVIVYEASPGSGSARFDLTITVMSWVGVPCLSRKKPTSVSSTPSTPLIDWAHSRLSAPSPTGTAFSGLMQEMPAKLYPLGSILFFRSGCPVSTPVSITATVTGFV